VQISLSSEVQPEFREYERFSTSLLNAYLQPVLAGYMSHLSTEVDRLSNGARVGINQSSGGLMSVARARDFPIRTALSGPASGAMGAIYMAKLSRLPRVITLDMGGTSADVALIRDFVAATSFSRDIASFPVRLPMVDINSVGAGGGSIAWFDLDGLLKVGPRSAGAVPGPACYGRGGVEATVTDANVVLGRLSGSGLLGGAMALDVAAAHAVIVPIASRLTLSIEKTAEGILDIVTANMVRAIRAVSVERGHDPREFALVAFGGAGALLGTAVARSLGISEVMVPHSPGLLCAQGLVVADLKEDFVQSKRVPLHDRYYDEISGMVHQLRTAAKAWFLQETVDSASQRVELSFDMRYVGQNFELNVKLPAEESGAALTKVDRVRELFLQAHEVSYGFSNPDADIEIIGFRLVARGITLAPPAAEEPPGASKTPQPVERRPVWFSGRVFEQTSVYQRTQLARGCKLTGPLIIDQFDATTVVHPGDTIEVDDVMNLRIRLN
jgi:N-methylhydantoinase A